jgi:NAD(P)-dependent dehydrogenase (short-subunit alcohol dehydrogenase family)
VRVWFVTGASRGLGAAIVREALARGHSVTATARNPEAVQRALGTSRSLLTAKVDVTDERQIREAVDATIARFSRIDVLVNNAGFGLIAAVEEASSRRCADQSRSGMSESTPILTRRTAELRTLAVVVTDNTNERGDGSGKDRRERQRLP